MTGILVALLGVLWAAVLVPVLFSARQNTSVSGSVGTFSRSMRALGSNHYQPSGGRWVLTPRPPEEEADRKAMMLRRRRIFCTLFGTFCFTLFLGLLPTMRGMLWAALVSAFALGGYAAFLIQQKQLAPIQHRLARVASAGAYDHLDDIPTVLKLAYTPPAPSASGMRRVHTITDDSLDEDGLGELSWLKAGRY